MKNNRKNNKESGRWVSLLYIVILLIGAGFILYPSVSDYYNSFHQSKAIASYVEAVNDASEEENKKMLELVKEYNKSLQNNNARWKKMSAEQREYYNSLLDVSGTGMMGYIEIPKLNISLGIYHTTEESVLQTAIGHVEGTSFPIGGIGTHSALSGHRGLPSAKLFTDLDKLEVGDEFYIIILNEVLTYEIDNIAIVLPNEMNLLNIDNDKDYCTLITCTPYGVNTHRLLVRGTRIETTKAKEIRITADADQISPTMIAPFIGVFIALIYLIYLILKPKRHK